jgi:hypothetical protein
MVTVNLYWLITKFIQDILIKVENRVKVHINGRMEILILDNLERIKEKVEDFINGNKVDIIKVNGIEIG